MNSLVSVIIPTCGRNDYFIACLKSVIAQTYPSLEVILIDNSLDPSVSRKADELSQTIQVYISPQNLYYCEGMNKGIELSHGEFVLCLNDDTVLDRFFIEEAMQGFALDSRIGMLSGKILRMDHETLDSTGLFLTSYRTAKERGYGELDKGQFDRREYIFGVSGAVAFFRKKMLDDIRENTGWFDSTFRMFYEDLDVAWRANNCGWRAYYMPSALSYHVRGGTARSESATGKKWARDYLTDDLCCDLIKNRYLMIIKNETWFGLLVCIVPIIIYDVFVWGYLVFFRSGVIYLLWSNLKCFSDVFNIRFSFRK